MHDSVKVYLQRQPFFNMLKITIKKYDPENFTTIVPLLFEVFGETPNSHLKTVF